MDLKDILQTVAERAHAKATVKTIFGDPINVEGITIIPVARVAYGFGAGGGWGPGSKSKTLEQSGGGGGGGGVRIAPAGIVEIGPDGTRFIAIGLRRRLVIALVLGLALGYFLARR